MKHAPRFVAHLPSEYHGDRQTAALIAAGERR